jgi:hypothetical protein
MAKLSHHQECVDATNWWLKALISSHFFSWTIFLGAGIEEPTAATWAIVR